ncbi:MAG: hypothetical protein IPN26_03560 [Bacteroidetes bacterium]|nr:hypothetical protein [Bacteroidota bacterium]
MVLNTWGLRYKKDNNDFDNSGDAILTEGIRNGVSYFNYIKNDLATTHQYGRLGLGTCCEHNKDCSAEFNYVSGYDRGIHIENGRGGFQVRYNRITGSETGIVMDGIRSYLKKYNPQLPSGQLYIECDAENASRIEYNYISNEEIPMQEDSLMKIYPPQLIFAHGMNRSNTDNASFLKITTHISISTIFRTIIRPLSLSIHLIRGHMLVTGIEVSHTIFFPRLKSRKWIAMFLKQRFRQIRVRI